jgi:hypothetical protein
MTQQEHLSVAVVLLSLTAMVAGYFVGWGHGYDDARKERREQRSKTPNQ